MWLGIYFILVYWEKLFGALDNRLIHRFHSDLSFLFSPAEGVGAVQGARRVEPD